MLKQIISLLKKGEKMRRQTFLKMLIPSLIFTLGILFHDYVQANFPLRATKLSHQYLSINKWGIAKQAATKRNKIRSEPRYVFLGNQINLIGSKRGWNYYKAV